MPYVTVYIVIVVIITVAVLYMFYCQNSQHQFQLARIRALEQKYAIRERELELLRARTQQCPVPNLNDPRSCYFGSNYTCSWNEQIGRCDLMT